MHVAAGTIVSIAGSPSQRIDTRQAGTTSDDVAGDGHNEAVR
jgi:hypothetical protein